MTVNNDIDDDSATKHGDSHSLPHHHGPAALCEGHPVRVHARSFHVFVRVHVRGFLDLARVHVRGFCTHQTCVRFVGKFLRLCRLMRLPGRPTNIGGASGSVGCAPSASGS